MTTTLTIRQVYFGAIRVGKIHTWEGVTLCRFFYQDDISLISRDFPTYDSFIDWLGEQRQASRIHT